MNRLPYDPAAAWRADLERYPAHPFVREQSVWALALFRFGQQNDRRPRGARRWVGDRAYWAAFRIVEVVTGVSFTKATEIGPGLRVHHFGNIFVNERSRIGARCTLRQGVTIGSIDDDGPAPVLGDDVDIGAYGQILGGVTVGDGARIGAMSVVLDDVPPGATVVGAPARVVTSGAPSNPSNQSDASDASAVATHRRTRPGRRDPDGQIAAPTR